MTSEERAHWQNVINEVSEIVNTAVVTDQMTVDEVIDYYSARLQAIYALVDWPKG